LNKVLYQLQIAHRIASVEVKATPIYSWLTSTLTEVSFLKLPSYIEKLGARSELLICTQI